MLVLGISGAYSFPYENIYKLYSYQFHDAAAVLVDDGKVVAAIEEERLNRIKHSNKAPVSAIKFCLDSYGVTLDQVDKIAFYFQESYLDNILQYYYLNNPEAKEFSGWRKYVARILEQASGESVDSNKIEFVSHHLAHAESAYLHSGFSESLVLVIDGRGDTGSGIIQKRKGNEITPLDNYSQPQSLGVFYLDVISYLGYTMFDEYKAMGLAPYGNPEKYRRYFKKFYTLLPDGQYNINRRYISVLFDLVTPRRKNGPFLQEHKDIAASLQEALETIVLHILKHHREKTGISKLCLAGGVAHNCSVNGKLLYSGLFDDIFVQPAAHDAGGALGSALYVANKGGAKGKRERLKAVYWGTKVGGNDEVLRILKKWDNFITYEKLENTVKDTARLIADGYVIGWVQGASEFGPRALGNRSIIADPRPAENKDIINEMIKKREAYRPFAPSIMEEYLEDYYEIPECSAEFPFMNFVLKAKKDKRALLEAVTHVDGTARVQTVSKETNRIYWELIDEFRKLTGIPIVLNTSFNNNAEPIVDSEQDAIVCYITTKLNYLVIGDYLISKKPFDNSSLLNTKLALTLHVVLSQDKKYISYEAAQVAYSISVNYSDSYNTEISPDMYSILLDADGNMTLEELFRKHDYIDMNKRESLSEELFKLWAKRMVIIKAV